jgi:hypothetical protein
MWRNSKRKKKATKKKRKMKEKRKDNDWGISLPQFLRRIFSTKPKFQTTICFIRNITSNDLYLDT